MPTIPLADLFLQSRGYASDTWEHFIPIYESELAPMIDDNVPISLLEIGVQNGGSIDIWERYLPEGSLIVGLDINPATSQLAFGSRTRVLQADATDAAQLNAALGEDSFDVIIDDGSHQSSDVRTTFDHCFHRLNGGGLYFIEDTSTSYWPEYGGGFQREQSTIEWLKTFVDALHSDYISESTVGAAELKRLRSLSREIGSVSFYDSLAVIWKLPTPKNRPNRRLWAGSDARAVPDARSAANLRRAHPHCLLIVDSSLTQLDTELLDAAEAQRSIAELSMALTATEARLSAIESSRTWRFSEPIRRALGRAREQVLRTLPSHLRKRPGRPT